MPPSSVDRRKWDPKILGSPRGPFAVAGKGSVVRICWCASTVRYTALAPDRFKDFSPDRSNTILAMAADLEREARRLASTPQPRAGSLASTRMPSHLGSAAVGQPRPKLSERLTPVMMKRTGAPPTRRDKDSARLRKNFRTVLTASRDVEDDCHWREAV